MSENSENYQDLILKLQDEKQAVRKASTAADLRQSVEKVEAVLSKSVNEDDLNASASEELQSLKQQLESYRLELQNVEDERISEFDNQVITTIGSIQYSLWHKDSASLYEFINSR